MTSRNPAHTVHVAVARSPYDIVVGRELVDHVAETAPLPPHAAKAVLVTSPSIYELYGERVLRSLRRTALEIRVLLVQDGEEAKTIETLQQCYAYFGEIALGRRDVVVTLGGGVIGDLAGFAAATWTRGVPVLHVATTLVAQVDSAIGGKTGVNLPSGKNLVGAFHQPIAVINDVSTLRTLPERELRAGLGEVVKYGFIADPVILSLLAGKSTQDVQRDDSLLEELVLRSAAVKAQVVAEDEFESGRREVLNYGHTLGHALETLGQYRTYLHGEAVAVGMVFAAALGERLGISESGLRDRTVAVLDSLGLPSAVREPCPAEEIWPVLQRDKKALGGVRFIVVPEPGSATLVTPEPDLVLDLLGEFGIR